MSRLLAHAEIGFNPFCVGIQTQHHFSRGFDKSPTTESTPIRHFNPEMTKRWRVSGLKEALPIVEGCKQKNFEDVKRVTGTEKRGVPAVMRCFDRAKVYVKAGDGGNGVVAFRREKFVPFGGPSGESGGNGGDVFLEADTAMNSLLPFRKQVHFRASRGAHGKGSSREGANGLECGEGADGDGGESIGRSGCGRRRSSADGAGEPGQKEFLLPGGRGGSLRREGIKHHSWRSMGKWDRKCG